MFFRTFLQMKYIKRSVIMASAVVGILTVAALAGFGLSFAQPIIISHNGNGNGNGGSGGAGGAGGDGGSGGHTGTGGGNANGGSANGGHGGNANGGNCNGNINCLKVSLRSGLEVAK
jgi:hypothetical protein